MKAIAAMAENRAIGKNGGLPWPSIKEDFKWFKEFTLNKMIVVGAKTSIGLPSLPKRKILILSGGRFNDSYWEPIKDQTVCYTNIETILKVDVAQKGEVIVAGGARTYELFMPYITEFYVTHVKGEYEADTFMPPFEHLFAKKDLVREVNGNQVIMYYSR